MTILERLKTLSEENYKNFNSKIIPTKQEMLGVRIPILKKIAKEIKLEDIEILFSTNENIYELILLEGFVISSSKKPFLELVPYIESYLKKVDSWAQIDSFILGFKGIKKEKVEVLKIVKRWLNSKDEFVVRTGLIILLAYYIQNEYLEEIFSLSNQITHKGYYVFMGNAWLISVCMAKFPLETIEFFKDNNLDVITHNKAIQKSRESRRVSKEDKEFIKTLKR